MRYFHPDNLEGCPEPRKQPQKTPEQIVEEAKLSHDLKNLFDGGERLIRAIDGLKADLDMLDGNSPYDGPENICRNDAYYAKSLERKYGMSIKKLRKIAGREK